YLNSKFIGIDISFVFPKTIRPINVDFFICNITKVVPFDDNSIDLFHQRLLVAGLHRSDYIKSLKEAYRILKPGGYIELGEVRIQVENIDLLNDFL
ncbi:hypothetical protein BDB01DRAFT_710374, partial [Pilobolus umbonatus]